MKSHINLNTQPQTPDTALKALLAAKPWDEVAIQAEINQAANNQLMNKLDQSSLALVQNRIQEEFKDHTEKLSGFITQQTVNKATSEKLAYLNQLKDALPNLKDLLIANLRSGDLNLLEAIRIQNSLNCMVEGVINSSLTEQHKESFELATAKLKNYPQWRIVLGLIIGAVAGLIAVASLALGGITAPIGVGIAGIMSTALCGGIFGFWTRHKNTTKQITDSAVELTTFSEEQENNTINLQDYTPEQIALQKELIDEINKLLSSIASQKQLDPVKSYIKKTLLLMKKDAADFKMSSKYQRWQMSHYKNLIDLANQKQHYTQRLEIKDLDLIIERVCPRSIFVEMKGQKIKPPMKHEIEAEYSSDRTYVNLKSDHLVAQKVPQREFSNFCHNTGAIKEFGFLKKTLALTQAQFNTHVEMLEQHAGCTVQLPNDAATRDNDRYQEEIAKAKQKKQAEALIDFLFRLSNKMENMLLEMDLDDKLSESHFTFAKLFSNNKTDVEIYHEKMKAELKSCLMAIKKMALDGNIDIDQLNNNVLSKIRELSSHKDSSYKWNSLHTKLAYYIYSEINESGIETNKKTEENEDTRLQVHQ